MLTHGFLYIETSTGGEQVDATVIELLQQTVQLLTEENATLKAELRTLQQQFNIFSLTHLNNAFTRLWYQLLVL